MNIIFRLVKHFQPGSELQNIAENGAQHAWMKVQQQQIFSLLMQLGIHRPDQMNRLRVLVLIQPWCIIDNQFSKLIVLRDAACFINEVHSKALFRSGELH